LLVHRGVFARAAAWSPDAAETARWEHAAAARLGDLAVFHDPRLERIGAAEDRRAGRMHLLEWDPADGRAPLPFALLETVHFFGPVPAPVLTTATHPLFVPWAAASAPGLLPELRANPPAALGARMRFLPHLPLGQGALGGVRGAASEAWEETVRPVVLARERWEGSWARSWAARSQGIKGDVPRVLPRLREVSEVDVHSSRTLADPDAMAALERAMELHARRWGGRANASSNLREAAHRGRLLALAECFEARGSLRLHWLTWQEDVRAFVLAVGAPGTLFIYWVTFDLALARYAPGNVLTAALLETAFAEGVQRIDFMFGDDSYKSRWSDGREPVSILLEPGSTASRAAAFHLVRNMRKLKAILKPAS